MGKPSKVSPTRELSPSKFYIGHVNGSKAIYLYELDKKVIRIHATVRDQASADTLEFRRRFVQRDVDDVVPAEAAIIKTMDMSLPVEAV